MTLNTSDSVSQEVQDHLIQLAKASIAYYLDANKEPNRDDLSHIETGISDPLLETERAAFVTLKLDSHLRGCIGSVFPTKPLTDEVIHQSVNAAFNDYRFNPVTESEYPNLKVEISILSQPSPVDHYDKIDIEKHGIILKKDNKSALFLPKVATEQGWDLPTTLTHLCQKAGLELFDWKSNTEFLVFEAFEFKE